MEAVRIGNVGTEKGKVKTGHRRVHLSKSYGEQVLFVTQGQGGPWTVVFDKSEGSPFGQTSYTVLAGSYKKSGAPDSNAAEGRYRYSVYDANGNLKDDPDIEIDA
ncbi:MAG: hypothetical protein EXQ59_03170 [Acidobacteria bacterium]|nr:hypothetical protein [Acidobacteriota bacterium]